MLRYVHVTTLHVTKYNTFKVVNYEAKLTTNVYMSKYIYSYVVQKNQDAYTFL